MGCFLGSRRRAAGICAVVVTICCLAQIRHLDRYYDRGRPHWAWLAESIAALVNPEGRVLASNAWSRICLEYYLSPHGVKVTEVGAHEVGAQSVRNVPSQGRVAAEPGCAYLVDGGYPRKTGLLRTLAPVFEVAVDPGGLGARLVRLGRFDPRRTCVWSLPPHLKTRPGWRPGHAAEPQRWVFDFGEPTRPHLLHGWADLERAAAGRTFAWITADEAFVALGPLSRRPRNLRLRARALTADQRVVLAINGRQIATFSPDKRWGEFTFQVPADVWSARDNLLRITCSKLISPQSADPNQRDPRRLALAVDQLVVEPSSADSRSAHNREGVPGE